jgi:hypothetical protein
MENLALVALGIFIAGVAWFLWLVAKKGWAKASAKVESWWNSATKALQSDVATVKTDVASIKSDVAALKTKVGL